MTTLAELDADPHPTYTRLRGLEPVCWLPEIDSWLVTGWRDVRAVLSDPARFANGHAAVHARFRAAYAQGLDPAEVDTITRPIARKAADDVSADGGADLTADYFEPVAAVTGATLLGIGLGGADTLLRWGRAFAAAANNAGRRDRPGTGAVGPATDTDITDGADLADVLARLRRTPDRSLVARLVDVDVHPVRVVKHLAVTVVESGWLAAWTLMALWADRTQLAAVRADRRLLAAAVYEALRWGGPTGVLSRRTTCAVSLGGKRIPAGHELAVSVTSANRDETVFADPHRFDLGRGLRPHLGFGVGPHHCPAHPLVTSVARTALDVLLDRLPDLRPAANWRPAPHGWRLRLPGPLDAVWAGQPRRQDGARP